MPTTRATSESHPIYVFCLPSQHPGRVGLTFAPGKKSMSKWSNTQWLVSQGLNADEAIDTLHRVHSPHCPETLGQEQFVQDFENRA